MKKPLSLKTQLAKLRSVLKLLRNTLPQSFITLESGYTDSSHHAILSDVIYSLRDIHYELRGLKTYRANRSKQLKHYSMAEILELLEAEITCSAKRHPEYRSNIQTALTELETVSYYLDAKAEKQKLKNQSTNSQDELF